MYNGEWDLLRLRIEWLQKMKKNVKHVIVESNYTFSGIKKLYSLHEKLTNYHFRNQVEVLQINLETIEGHWEKEYKTREELLNYVKKKYHPCLIILSDLDELPSEEQLNDFIERNRLDPLKEFDFRMNTYVRKINYFFPRCSPIDCGQFLVSNQPTKLNAGRHWRINSDSSDISLIQENPGFHLTYCFTEERELVNKVISFADFQEYRLVLPWLKSIIDYANFYFLDHMGNMTRKGFGLLIPIEESNKLMKFAESIFPRLIDRNPKPPTLLARLWASARISALYDGARCFFLPRNESRAKTFGEYYFGTLDSIPNKKRILFFLIHIHQLYSGIRQAFSRMK